ncbi:NAD(P)/FAD-dependent oxidoreductase [Oscillatoria acuminata]|uniref:NAD(FAD)-dependent dehydrogenase n=1 Tax=Oscillatoria acuminata PCC 6304 TaxID=56110 RepID=K9TS45_9CYAN|nr:FAD/NAD(P)-binding oxidoreductase [Oscillatoria acuminata]AFY85365.1 NAD(FAD)-dependent dehydrogenase [Oscillatoria acuminata PCC 6304]
MVNLTQHPSQLQIPQPQTPVRKTIHHQILAIGGGSAGISTSSQLLAKNPALDIAIIEPSDIHYYQPGWTLTGGGVFQIEDTRKPQKDVMPKGVTWIKDKAVKLNPDGNTVITASGLEIEYDCLIVCPGIQIDWHLIKGLKQALGKEGVTSNYSPTYAPYTWETIKNFQGGNALFTFPNTPIKCGGASQKVMYMADDTFRSKWGVRECSNVMFLTADTKMFTVPAYSQILENVVKEREIEVKFQHNLKEIRPETKEAIFDILGESGPVDELSMKYDMIHVAPPQSAPDFIKQSPLAVPNNPYGWVDVDRDTLQHKRYLNVFALGDVSSLPTSKTVAAVRKQAPVLAENLLAFLDSKPLPSRYDGYTCCPLITGYHKTVMAEFDGYNGRLISSFPLNPTKERWIMWLMKKHLMPWIYWNRMLKGSRFEGDYIKFMQWQAGAED